MVLIVIVCIQTYCGVEIYRCAVCPCCRIGEEHDIGIRNKHSVFCHAASEFHCRCGRHFIRCLRRRITDELHFQIGYRTCDFEVINSIALRISEASVSSLGFAADRFAADHCLDCTPCRVEIDKSEYRYAFSGIIESRNRYLILLYTIDCLLLICASIVCVFCNQDRLGFSIVFILENNIVSVFRDLDAIDLAVYGC